jgi:NAD(P)-dependent dehydrogenase (short-subunit alcohol dehydrogenase family)
MSHFDGRVVLITGAGGGLGREYALLLAAEGAQVVVNDYGGDRAGNSGTSEAADRVVAEILGAGGQAVADAHDVALDGAAVVRTAVESFGGLHAAINNAGISGGGEFADIPEAAFDRMLQIHLGGTLAVSRAAWPILKAQQYGRIVNTSSASVFGFGSTSAYITAKAGIFGLTRALARDGKRHGIKVNAIMPSAYSRLTAQSPELGPLMQSDFPAQQVAPFVAALASAEVPVTGETFSVGGGRAASVVLATVPGATGLTTVDNVLASFDEVMRSDDIFVPEDANAAVLYDCEQIGADTSSFLKAGSGLQG